MLVGVDGMSVIDLFVVGFGRPDLLAHQHRLLTKYLGDDFTLNVLDNTQDTGLALEMQRIASEVGSYLPVKSAKHEHPDALKIAAAVAEGMASDYWGTLDHDVFPRGPVTLIDKIDQAGFYGIGQRHTPTQTQYLWPGFCFWKREWLAGRTPNYDGIRGIDKRDDGDCGSMLHTLFDVEDWARLARPEHGYGTIRPPDTYGLQSFGYEFFDGWVHLTNASRWMQVPDPDGRDSALLNMLAAL